MRRDSFYFFPLKNAKFLNAVTIFCCYKNSTAAIFMARVAVKIASQLFLRLAVKIASAIFKKVLGLWL